ncbi:LysR family transcriptional regulator [Devosia neptuniae]|jgi:DNA-binding transcriptional LysR family regulator|uniref:LysR family transcriptional regulator n=1 Tax=Devosia TaxID=46913 RepID=UPI0022AFEE9A|nr:LysR family transcriptional regulator [Devosia neptuniae]MCZ4347026.1 LysR family transcriptional regulator [Devosia neptuniae]|tara:strand:+ start:10638 stop:11516 length:879 start_codon:yes stop_codon:yes gene_type:complete
MNDRLLALRVFCRVARLGSFSQAGRALNLSQSSTSRIVSELERELGVTLLTRTTRAVALTEAGADYLERAERILDAMEEADHAVRGDGRLTGRLRIGLSSSFGLRKVVPRLAGFMARHETLTVDLAVSDGHQDLVSEGIDIAFRLGALVDSTTLVRKLGETPRILAASPDYLASRPTIVTPHDLAAHELIVGPGVVPQELNFQCGGERITIRASGRTTCIANEGATAAARAGLGITVSSIWGVEAEIASGQLVQVLAGWHVGNVALHAVFPPGRQPRPAARALADLFVGQRL